MRRAACPRLAGRIGEAFAADVEAATAALLKPHVERWDEGAATKATEARRSNMPNWDDWQDRAKFGHTLAEARAAVDGQSLGSQLSAAIKRAASPTA